MRVIDYAEEEKKHQTERKRALLEGFPARLILTQHPFYVHMAHRGEALLCT